MKSRSLFVLLPKNINANTILAQLLFLSTFAIPLLPGVFLFFLVYSSSSWCIPLLPGYVMQNQPLCRGNTRMKPVISDTTTFKITKLLKTYNEVFYSCFSATYLMRKGLVPGFAAKCMCSVRVGITSQI